MARVVLAALDGPLGVQKLLVIKEMLPELAKDPEFVTMFTDEARIASRLDHPNVVQTYELVHEDDRYFFVMEYLEGQSLSAVNARLRREIPLPILLRVFTRLLAGLHYAHELTDLDGKPLSIVHRDVTPQNVFLGYGGVVKLVDFGIAKAAGAGVKTQTGVFKGKLSYAAPEQLESVPLDRRVDVFSVGVMLWEGLTRQRITKDLSEPAIYARRLVGDPRVEEVAPDAPPALAAICNRAISRDREDRYPTAEAMRLDLERAIEELGLRATDEDIGQFLNGHFAAERTETRRRVQERLTLSSGSIAVAPPLVEPMPESARGATGEPVTITQSGTTQNLAVTAPRRSGVLVATLAVAVALGVTASFGAILFLRQKPAAVADKPVEKAVAPAESVAVSVVVTPPNASVTIDDTSVGQAPYRASMPRDTKGHRLVVTLAGYRTAERQIAFDRDLQLELTLEPEPPAASAAPAAGKPPPAPAPGRAPPVRPSRATKPIDTADPYGK